MKPATIIKIVLPVLVVAAIAVLVWRNWDSIIGPGGGSLDHGNQEIEEIQAEIDALGEQPSSTFCDSLYEEIAYRIRDDQKEKLLGKKESDNNRWAEILNKRLQGTYSSLFIRQTWYVFNGSTWESGDIGTIGQITDKLMNNQYLETGTATYDSLEQIQTILKEYSDYLGFISGCKKYSFSDINLDTWFPDMSDKLRHARKQPPFPVSNCTRIGEELATIPATLFKKHKDYLKTKINKYGPLYKDYQTYRAYQEQICTPLSNQIRDLNNRGYGMTDSECYTLLDGYKNKARKKFDSGTSYR